MRPFRMDPVTQREAWRQERLNGFPPFVTDRLVRRYPNRAYRLYRQALEDGYEGRAARTTNRLYQRWYREGRALRDASAPESLIR